jgi:threonine synthase
MKGIFLETAHPVKFYDVVEPLLGEKIPIPDSIRTILEKEKQSISLEANYGALKEYLRNKK